MLGDQIRAIRKRQEITLKELAEKAGLSIGYISQIERGLTDPSLSTLRKISAALGVPTYLFLGSEGYPGLTLRSGEMIRMSQPDSSVRYQILSPMPSGEFSPRSLAIRFVLDPFSADGELPVIHPSEEIIILEKGAVRRCGSPASAAPQGRRRRRGRPRPGKKRQRKKAGSGPKRGRNAGLFAFVLICEARAQRTARPVYPNGGKAGRFFSNGKE